MSATVSSNRLRNPGPVTPNTSSVSVPSPFKLVSAPPVANVAPSAALMLASALALRPMETVVPLSATVMFRGIEKRMSCAKCRRSIPRFADSGVVARASLLFGTALSGLLRGIVIGVEITLRASANGWTTQEKTFLPMSRAGDSAVVLKLSKRER